MKSEDSVILTEQAMYDFRNDMRKASELNDLDDEDYTEDEDIDSESDEQQQNEILTPLTSHSIIINSITSTVRNVTTMVTTTTTIATIATVATTVVHMNNSQTDMIDITVSNDQFRIISSSTRLLPMFTYFVFTLSSLYRYIYMHSFLF